MEITEVKVFTVREEKVKAFVSIILDRCFMVNDIKIIQGRDGLFISMPSRRKRNGKFKDVAHPLNNETRSRMEKRILGEYERALASGDESEPVESETRLGPLEPVEKPAARPLPETRSEPQPEHGVVREPAQTERAPAEEAAPASEDRTLEEVAEEHLKDSFWTT